MKNYEIELKFQLEEEERKKFSSWLSKQSLFVGKNNYQDYYFDNPNETFFFDSPHGYRDYKQVLRVRVIDKISAVVTTKIREFDEKKNNILAVQEYETIVDDWSSMIKIFQTLGYRHVYEFNKIRKIFTYNDFEIVMDDVDGLGEFFEIEYQGACLSVKEGQNEILEFLIFCGISKIKVFNIGYLGMVLNSSYDFRSSIEL